VGTETPRTRGRPRRFDRDAAIATAQRLFHARGYDAVSVADLTDALGINPPSFYAAFGSKAGLYARVLERYDTTGAVPFARLLRRDRPVVACLAAVLEETARHYAANPDAAGCLVVEGTHCNDQSAREATIPYNLAAEAMIRRYIAERHPDEAERLTDFVATTMFGMSAKARQGHSLNQLLATARLAGAALKSAVTSESAS
jgi:TetR/AcrR family transcriptional repressor for divergent bdcA